MRRSDQTSAEMLVMRVATAINREGSRIGMASDSEALSCSLYVPYRQ